MKTFEVNGNLPQENYSTFLEDINKVYSIFSSHFGENIMKKIDLFVDNATGNSTGYTPMAIPVLQKYIIIKLGLNNFEDSARTIYQFSHELCHYVFYSIKGIDKPLADAKEESICSAMSLIIVRELSPISFGRYFDYVSKLENESWRKGAEIAKSINFDIIKLVAIIFDECR